MAEHLLLDPDELLTTTRTVRKRLDLDRPVPRALAEECIEIALQAPNGSNQQSWTWLVVDDPKLRSGMANIYRATLDAHRSDPDRATRDIDYGGGTQGRISASVMHLVEHMQDVPVLVVPCFRGRLDNADVFLQASMWGSILPSVWSFMLAARARGLGSAWTTLHLHNEAAMSELLGIPDGYTQAGMFPLAYTIGTNFRPGERRPAAEVTKWNGWAGEDTSS